MMIPKTSFLIAALVIASLQLPSKAEDHWTADQLLPSHSLVFAQISQPEKFIDTVWNHPSVKTVLELEEYQQAIKTKPFRDALALKNMVEEKLGSDWRSIIKNSSNQGIYFAASFDGGAVLIHNDDPQLLKDLFKTGREIAGYVASEAGRDVPFETFTHEDETVYQSKRAFVAPVGPWLIVSPQRHWVTGIIDRMKKKYKGSLVEQGYYLQAKEQAKDHNAWVYVNTVLVKNLPPVTKAIGVKQEGNIITELFAGGLLAAFQNSSFLLVTADIENESLELQLVLPSEFEKFKTPRSFTLNQKDAEPLKRFQPARTLLTLSMQRDLGKMWQSSNELFNDRMAVEISEADANLSQFFSGRDFGSDILSNLHSNIQLVVAEQDFTNSKYRPELELPAGALIVRTDGSEDLTDTMLVTYQTMMGFGNFLANQEGRVTFMQSQDSFTDGFLSHAKPFLNPKDPTTEGNILFNLSPSIGAWKDYLVISSSKQLAEDVLKEIQSDKKDLGKARNTDLSINLKNLQKYLDAIKPQLVAENQLEEAVSHEKAEENVNKLFQIVQPFEGFDLNIDMTPKSVQFKLKLSWNESK